MKAIARIITIAALLLAAAPAVVAQNNGNDVFIPIAKYITQGNVDALSAWFDDNLEISVISKSTYSSRSQARRIVQRFFDTYTPRSFNLDHSAGRINMKYALGSLNAGGENFIVTIFVCRKNGTYHIQQFQIERMR